MKLEENRAPDPKEESAAGDRQEIMEIAMRAGHILLENGAEISRVEETGSAVITGSSRQIRLSSAMGSFPPWETREKNSLPGCSTFPSAAPT